MIENREKKVGSFYGLHHGKESEFRHYKILKIDIAYILKCFDSPYYNSQSYINNLVCMEAGGSGNKARALALAGCKNVHYIDLSKENTDFVKNEAKNKDLPISVINDSMLNPHPELNDKFDLIICKGVIQHTADPALCLLHLRNWLKKDGCLIINCYQSGTLRMFWISLIREIISMLNIEYSELLSYVGLYNKLRREPNLSISAFWDTRIKTELMDHALVDVLQPTTPTIFQMNHNQTKD